VAANLACFPSCDVWIPTLQEPEAFEKRVQSVLDRVERAERRAGSDEIRLPGKRSALLAASAAKTGLVAVEENLLQDLMCMATGGTNRNGSGASASPTWGIGTRLVHPSSAGLDDPYAAMAPPLYQTATFKQPSATKNGPFDYTRSGNPTRQLLEYNMASIEGGARGLAFVTGMAAINAACRLVQSGGHIVAGDDIYGGTSRLLSAVLPEQGIAVTNVDHTDLDAYRQAFQHGRTKLVLLESPTNPRMQV
jgi:cysteine-S-conjugate beta-lyase